MPTTPRDAVFMRRMIAMMLAGAFLLVVGALLDPFIPDHSTHKESSWRV